MGRAFSAVSLLERGHSTPECHPLPSPAPASVPFSRQGTSLCNQQPLSVQPQPLGHLPDIPSLAFPDPCRALSSWSPSNGSEGFAQTLRVGAPWNASANVENFPFAFSLNIWQELKFPPGEPISHIETKLFSFLYSLSQSQIEKEWFPLK